MDDRLKIASDMMAVLMTNPHWLDAEWPEYASAALDAADALLAEDERTRPATVGEALADLSNKTIAGQSAQEVAERYRELEGRYSETESDIASLTDALNGALRNAGLDGEQMQAPCLREMKSLIWLLSYAAVRGQQLAAQPGIVGAQMERIAALEAENAELRERKDGAYEERNRVVAPAREEG